MAGGAMLGFCARWLATRCLDFVPNGCQHNALILRLMAAQCIDVAPDDWRRDASILHLMAAQCIDVALNG
jgi:hypothetical protein